MNTRDLKPVKRGLAWLGYFVIIPLVCIPWWYGFISLVSLLW